MFLHLSVDFLPPFLCSHGDPGKSSESPTCLPSDSYCAFDTQASGSSAYQHPEGCHTGTQSLINIRINPVFYPASVPPGKNP